MSYIIYSHTLLGGRLYRCAATTSKHACDSNSVDRKPVDNLFMFELFSKCQCFPTAVSRKLGWLHSECLFPTAYIYGVSYAFPAISCTVRFFCAYTHPLICCRTTVLHTGEEAHMIQPSISGMRTDQSGAF